MTDRHLTANVRSHDRVARRYERRHGEIFNPVEQTRLRERLAQAVSAIRTGRTDLRALDFGSGSGNVTRHLIAMGISTTAADVSAEFLKLVSERFGGTGLCTTLRLVANGSASIPDESYDLVVAYSVLHHIPDYLAAVDHLTRLLRPGGVLYLDHEASPKLWEGSTEYDAWLATKRRLPWYVEQLTTMTLNWPLYRLRRSFDPRATEEGDVHVWPDDHIDWDAIGSILAARSFDVILTEDYLLYRRHFDLARYQWYRERCADTRLLLARRRGGPGHDSNRRYAAV